MLSCQQLKSALRPTLLYTEAVLPCWEVSLDSMGIDSSCADSNTIPETSTLKKCYTFYFNYLPESFAPPESLLGIVELLGGNKERQLSLWRNPKSRSRGTGLFFLSFAFQLLRGEQWCFLHFPGYDE